MNEDTTRWIEYRSHRFPYRWHRGASSCDTPIVFLGGAFQTMDSWNRFVSAFRPVCDVLLVDLPGSGEAAPLGADEPISMLSDSLAHLLDALGIQQVYAIAASYGTPAAYQFAQRYPEKVERMALCGIMKEIPAHERSTVARSVHMAISGDLDGLAQACVKGLLSDSPQHKIRRTRLARRVLTSGILSMTPASRQRYALNTSRLLQSAPLDLDRPPQVRCLAFTGEHDAFTTPGRVREVARAMPGAAFTLVREADHLCHIERFEVVVDLLKRFQDDSLGYASSPDWLPVEWTPSDRYCPKSGSATVRPLPTGKTDFAETR